MATSESGNNPVNLLRLWETASTRLICTLGEDLGSATIAFSPNGRSLLYSCFNERSALVRDLSTFANLQQVTGPEFDAVCLASGRFLKPLPAYPGTITCASFSPDGKTLVTASTDGTLLLSQLDQFLQPLAEKNPSAPPSAAGFGKTWPTRMPGSPIAGWLQLMGDPTCTVGLSQKHLRPVLAPEPSRLRSGFADLDSKSFAVRTKASAALEKLGELVEPDLQRATLAPVSLEMRRRLEGLQEKAFHSRRLPLRLREVRPGRA